MYSNDAGLLQVNLSQLSAYDMDQNIPTITVTFEGGDERT